MCELIEEMEMEDRAVGVAGVGCGFFFNLVMNIDGINTAHGRPPDVATGIKRARPDLLVFTIQGDGDCIAIGAGSLINAAARAERITVIMVNNGNYGTTGGQMAPTTLLGQVTTTTPQGRMPRTGYPIHVPELLSSIKGVAYCARGALNSPANYQRTKRYIRKALEKQLRDVGFSFVEVLSACPPTWHLSPVESLKWIEEKMIPEFPLGEFKDVEEID